MPEVAALAADLRLAAHRLTRRLRQQRPQDGLTLTQLSALAVIWREGPLTAGDLAVREQVKPPSITRVLALLQAEGLVKRSIGADDRRHVLIQITPAGSARLEADVQAREAWLARQLDTLTQQERDLLRRSVALIDRLAEQ